MGVVRESPPRNLENDMRGRSQATLILEAAIHEIVNERSPITVRGIAYALFTQELIGDMTTKNTAKVSRIATAMREREELDWELIVDDSRQVRTVAAWSNPEAIINSAVRGYRKDYWEDQDYTVEVWAEKGTVGGILQPVLDELGVAFRVMKGFGSFTSVRRAAQDAGESSWDKEFVALYIGDHDPSGLHMSEVDLPERLERYGFEGDFQRIAVTKEDRKCASFSASTKKSDPRYKWFAQNYGDTCWELDAINPSTLRDRVQRNIEAHIDFDRWNKCIMVEEAEVESMQAFRKSWLTAK
jgi:hypothetical protein